MADTLVRKVLLQLSADDGDTEAKLDAITAKANALKELHPELTPKIDIAAASAKMAALKAELKDIGSPVIKPKLEDTDPLIKPVLDPGAMDQVNDKLKELDEKLKDQVDKLREQASKLGEAVAKAGEKAEGAGEKEGEAKLAKLGAQLEKLNETLAKPKIDVVGVAEANAEIKGVEAKLDGLSKDAEKAGEKAEKESGEEGEKSGSSFSEGFSGVFSNPYVIGGAIALALATLPAIAAAGGAAAGIALGAALLVGTSSVQGPLYKQFHTMTGTLTSVMRLAALPLVKPLGAAFTQIGKWAKALYPELHSVFGSLGPLVMPLTKGLEGLVDGVLPGFLKLMQAAKPAVSAVSDILSTLGKNLGGMLSAFVPGVQASSQVLGGLLGIVGSLLPPLATFGSDLAMELGPVMKELGSKVMPELAGALNKILTGLEPLMPQFGQLLNLTLQLELGPMPGLIDSLASLAEKWLPIVIPPLETLVGWLQNVVNWTNNVLNALSKIPGMGFLAVHPVAAQLMPNTASGWKATGASAAYDAAAAAAGDGAWASGVTGDGTTSSTAAAATAAQIAAATKLGNQVTAALGSGIRETMPQAETAARKLAEAVHTELLAGKITQAEASTLITSIDKQLQSRAAKVTAEAQKLGLALNGALTDSIASAASASAAKTAVGKLLSDVTAAWQSGLISPSRDQSLSTWLDGESAKLQALAAQRQKITAQIAAAKAYAASTASSIASGYDLSSAATTSSGGTRSVAGTISTLDADVASIRKFGVNVKKLAHEGLDKNYLGQLIALGPVQGGALAAELAAANLGQIKSINSAEYAISTASGQLGKLSANAIYDTGKQAGRGFLSGLEAQQASISKMMTAIAKSMVTTVRKELGLPASGAAAKVEIRLVGGDAAFRTWLKKMIRVTGGDVTVVGR